MSIIEKPIAEFSNPEISGPAQSSPERLDGYVHYFAALAAQPPGNWAGFSRPRVEAMNYGLRFQLAFSTYALAALSQVVTPELKEICITTMSRLLDMMLHPDTWRYWTANPRYSPDPLGQDNVMYSGHLYQMIGLYELISGNKRFDEEFILDDQAGHHFSYTHQTLAREIHRQMRDNFHHGVSCEPGCVYVSCNVHTATGNILFDRTHATAIAEVNKEWNRSVRRRLVLPWWNPLSRKGSFNVMFMERVRVSFPLPFNFTDFWSLAFMSPYDPGLLGKLYPRAKRSLRKATDGTFYVPSAGFNSGLEISDVPVNSGFGYILGREYGDEEVATGIYNHALNHFAPTWSGESFHFNAGLSPVYTTALFALGESLSKGAWRRLVRGEL